MHACATIIAVFWWMNNRDITKGHQFYADVSMNLHLGIWKECMAQS